MLRCAKIDDFERVTSFYKYVINNTPDMTRYARWVYGLHPTDAMIMEYIEHDTMYILEEESTIVAAMAVTMLQGEDYLSIDWQFDVKDYEVAVVHILCVNPDFQGQGIGRRMIKESINLAMKEDKKVLRLDALESNLPAHRLYESFGFRCRGKRKLYAENTDWTNFLFFELKI